MKYGFRRHKHGNALSDPKLTYSPGARGQEELHDAPQRSLVLRAVTREPLWFQTRFMWNKSPGSHGTLRSRGAVESASRLGAFPPETHPSNSRTVQTKVCSIKTPLAAGLYHKVNLINGTFARKRRNDWSGERQQRVSEETWPGLLPSLEVGEGTEGWG